MTNTSLSTAAIRPLARRLHTGSIAAAMVGLALSMTMPAQAHAELTRAGVVINNTASASYDDAAGTTNTVTSNTVSLRVDELIDVAVTSADSGDVGTTPGAGATVLSWRLTVFA